MSPFTEKNLDLRHQIFPLGHGEGGSQREKRVPNAVDPEMPRQGKKQDQDRKF